MEATFGSTIATSDLVKLLWVHRLPSNYNYQSRAVQDQDKVDWDKFEVSLKAEWRRISSTTSKRPTVPIPAVLSVPTAHVATIAKGACAHFKDSTGCWTCNPELRPVCLPCKKLGLNRYYHTAHSRICPTPDPATPKPVAKVVVYHPQAPVEHDVDLAAIGTYTPIKNISLFTHVTRIQLTLTLTLTRSGSLRCWFASRPDPTQTGM